MKKFDKILILCSPFPENIFKEYFTMFKLLVILFIITLYARTNVLIVNALKKSCCSAVGDLMKSFEKNKKLLWFDLTSPLLFSNSHS